jgi:glycylpeptide N-tetradecanoyltransferase
MSEPSGKKPAENPEGRKDAIRAALQGVQIDDDDASGADAKHLFWDTQPVPGLSEDFPEDGRMGPIDHTDLAAVRTEPYTLLASFQWTDVNLDSDVECKELYTLLHENYVEDGDQMFRFDYSMPFLRWALQPPGYRPEWFVGVRVAQTQKLVAFIACTPALLYCHGTRVQPSQPEAKEDEATSSDDEPSVVEVNFLCVHKKLRSKRLAPVLIKEITRRVNVCGIFQAAYTAGIVLPKPVARCRYWHRSLNPKKLIEVGFSRLAPRMTMTRTVKLYGLPEAPSTRGLRPMVAADCEEACAALNKHLMKYAIAPQLSEAEFKHWLLPRTDVIYSFVVEHPETHKITDMVSFYSLPSSVLGNEKHTQLRAAYCYYVFANGTKLLDLMQDALILAKTHHFDVFNALDILDNETFLKELKFGIGDGHLQYYMYNWRCANVKPNQVGLVLL